MFTVDAGAWASDQHRRVSYGVQYTQVSSVLITDLPFTVRAQRDLRRRRKATRIAVYRSIAAAALAGTVIAGECRVFDGV